jgi:hypothetical protein
VLELATLAQTYMLKDELGASPAQVSIFLSVAGIPWTIKPLIGFVSGAFTQLPLSSCNAQHQLTQVTIQAA